MFSSGQDRTESPVGHTSSSTTVLWVMGKTQTTVLGKTPFFNSVYYYLVMALEKHFWHIHHK